MEVRNNYLLYRRFYFSFLGFKEGLKKGELVKGVPRMICMLISLKGIRAVSIRG
jgi:hypothetical protein